MGMAQSAPIRIQISRIRRRRRPGPPIRIQIQIQIPRLLLHSRSSTHRGVLFNVIPSYLPAPYLPTYLSICLSPSQFKIQPGPAPPCCFHLARLCCFGQYISRNTAATVISSDRVFPITPSPRRERVQGAFGSGSSECSMTFILLRLPYSDPSYLVCTSSCTYWDAVRRLISSSSITLLLQAIPPIPRPGERLFIINI